MFKILLLLLLFSNYFIFIKMLILEIANISLLNKLNLRIKLQRYSKIY
jgi:hypothetical protein